MMRIVLLAGVAALALAACTTTEAAAPAAPAATAAVAAVPAPPAATTPAPNTQPFARVVDLGQGVSMLIGQGGNLGLSVGDDGVFLIDDQFAPLAPRIKAAIAAITRSLKSLGCGLV